MTPVVTHKTLCKLSLEELEMMLDAVRCGKIVDMIYAEARDRAPKNEHELKAQARIFIEVAEAISERTGVADTPVR